MRALLGLKICLLLLAAAMFASDRASAQSSLNPGYAEQDAKYSPSARAGREIWFFATAFNDRFYTYSYPQRLGGGIDWFKILSAKNKRDLFPGWGITPDPDCCIPGDPNCPARSLDETYGFQYCKGDEELLKFVGREGYRDPACDFKDSPFDTRTPHGAKDQRQDPCDLRFGTSTGALGLRKFPNPRFDAAKWRKLNNDSLATWEAYGKFMSGETGDGDSRTNRLFDGSIEPPFRIGMSCGACHISYDPVSPPADPANPKWDNIDGLVGNQFSRISQLLASGMSQHLVEWQLIARTRPGTVDTSALPMDTISNPGTMNAIANFARRPVFPNTILKWRKASQCPGGTPTCWCEPEKPGKCWQRSEQVEQVQSILKGGEDSIGKEEAIQRVYFNIGSCAEQCWMNHLPDLRAIDPTQRNYGQTPLDIGQCRRDCASFRAIEDRLDDVVAFFLSARPADLAKARGVTPEALDAQLDQEFGAGSVALGAKVFGRTCAGCHSSQANPSENTNFRVTDPADPGLRLDFLSNEKPIFASRVGTYAGRAMHSNHMTSRIWAQYASREIQRREADPAVMEVMKGGGRGYYRPPSLLSVWAYAPLMLNNAMGPEVCGKPDDPFYSSPYVDENDKRVANPPPCVPFAVSVEGRYELFKQSIDQLLNPTKRGRKVNVLDQDVIVDIASGVTIRKFRFGTFSIRLPEGSPAILINSLRYKDLLQDVVLVKRDYAKFAAKYNGILSPERLKELAAGLRRLGPALVKANIGDFTFDLSGRESAFIQTFYSNVLGRVENSGHLFGENLTDREKKALTAFLATL